MKSAGHKLISVILACLIFCAESHGSAALKTCELTVNPLGLFASAHSQGRFQVSIVPLSTLTFSAEAPAEAENYRETLTRVAAFLSDTAAAPTSLLSPAAGFDADTAFRILPDLNTVIAIDNHPFGQAGNIGSLTAIQATNESGYVGAGTIHELGFIGGAILARLMQGLPALRLHQVTLLEETQPSGSRPRAHGLVEFDLGPGTPLRRYYHIDGDGINAPLSAQPWWLGAILAEGFSAILRKGAMDFFAANPSSGTYLIQHLRNAGGIFIDGDGSFNLDRREFLSLNLRITESPIAGFGYAQKVTLLELGGR